MKPNTHIVRKMLFCLVLIEPLWVWNYFPCDLSTSLLGPVLVWGFIESMSETPMSPALPIYFCKIAKKIQTLIQERTLRIFFFLLDLYLSEFTNGSNEKQHISQDLSLLERSTTPPSISHMITPPTLESYGDICLTRPHLQD